MEACSWGQHEPHVACVRVFIHAAARLLCLSLYPCVRGCDTLAFVLCVWACLRELHWGPCPRIGRCTVRASEIRDDPVLLGTLGLNPDWLPLSIGTGGGSPGGEPQSGPAGGG